MLILVNGFQVFAQALTLSYPITIIYPRFGVPWFGDPWSGDPQSGDHLSEDPSGDPQSWDPQSWQVLSAVLWFFANSKDHFQVCLILLLLLLLT